MDRMMSKASHLTAENDVAQYFRDEAAELEGQRGASSSSSESSGSSGGWWSRLVGWFGASGEGESEEGRVPPRERETRHRKVLLVDDERDGVEALVGMFRKSGYEAEAVGSAEQAMASIRARRPEVVLVDVMMPGRDGVELLREIRADPATAKLPVLMVTANHRRVLESFTYGAQDYLMKPVEWGRVRESVEKQLGRGGDLGA
jgi:twitching motility two-component system response regulator PilH